MGEKCVWSEDEDGVWDTECGNRFTVEAGTPAENDMRFCPYCGKVLEEVRYSTGN